MRERVRSSEKCSSWYTTSLIRLATFLCMFVVIGLLGSSLRLVFIWMHLLISVGGAVAQRLECTTDNRGVSGHGLHHSTWSIMSTQCWIVIKKNVTLGKRFVCWCCFSKLTKPIQCIHCVHQDKDRDVIEVNKFGNDSNSHLTQEDWCNSKH